MRVSSLSFALVTLSLSLVACGSDEGSSESTSTEPGGTTTGGAGKSSTGGAGGSTSGKGGSAQGGSAQGGKAQAGSGQGGTSQGGAGGAGGSSTGGAGGKAQGGSTQGGSSQGGGAQAGSGQGGSGQGGSAQGGNAQGGAGQAGSGQAGSAQGGGGAGGCTSSTQCNGGVCVEGLCCASIDRVCGGDCCGDGEVCLFEACVTPGGDCKTSADCAANQYCETSLGQNAGGAGGEGGAGGATGGAGGGGPVCSQPLPALGKCVALPPVCDANGQPAGCVEKCEYIPTAGNLNAVEKWNWGAPPAEYPGRPDVWSTPVVGRVVDANCDGFLDELDPPNVVFVSGNTSNTCCQCDGAVPTSCHKGVLRVLDGRTGTELWSNAAPIAGSPGFSGVSPALGDIDKDGKLDIVAVDGEGHVVVFDGSEKLIGQSDKPIPNAAADSFGWGGGLSLGDWDADGYPEIAYGRIVYTTKDLAATGKLTRIFVGAAGLGGTANHTALSYFADVDGSGDGQLELVAGTTVYTNAGAVLWTRAGIGDGFTAIADFNKDGTPEIALVSDGTLYVLNVADGTDACAPFVIPGKGNGGTPTVADFDGDGLPEVGVAMQDFYSVLKPSIADKTTSLVWQMPTHDLSSSVTGSSVFDFEGDGKAEVVYNDECYLWVFDGATGAVRYTNFTSSFTGTEASLVADIDGDGHAEILLIGNSADPGPDGWKCVGSTTNGVAWQKGPAANGSYRGLRAFGDAANSWVGTRQLWSQHAYYVTNVCSGDDSACDPGENAYGVIPKNQRSNWKQPWLNNFRQNVQEKGLFNAPDATLSLAVACTSPLEATVSVKNAGLAVLPAGVDVEVHRASDQKPLGTLKTTKALGPGQTEKMVLVVNPADATESDDFEASIVVDPQNPTFRECRDSNNKAGPVSPSCIKP